MLKKNVVAGFMLALCTATTASAADFKLSSTSIAEGQQLASTFVLRASAARAEISRRSSPGQVRPPVRRALPLRPMTRMPPQAQAGGTGTW